MEEWKDIIGYQGDYQISCDGRVRSLKRKSQQKNCYISKRGYFTTRLWVNNKSKLLTIHRLIGIHFIPNPHNYGDINHINGNKLDNRIENLEWCTRRHNIIHAYETGLHKKKLSDQLIKVCRSLYYMGVSFRKLGEKYNVSHGTISKAIKREYPSFLTQ